MDLGFLSPLTDRPGPWASVYVDTSRRSETAAASQDVEFRNACDALSRQGADAATVRAVHEALEALPRSGAAPGHALFAAGGEVALVVPLPVSPHGERTDWSPLPHTGPLLEYTGENPPCLVAYIDRTGADVELRDDLGSESLGGHQGAQWPVHRTPTADWSERHFQLKVENTWEQNAAEIADALHTGWDETGAEAVVLVGDPRECRAVHDRLPENMRAATTEAEHGGRAAGSDSKLLDGEVAEARTRLVRDRTADALDRFRAGRARPDSGPTAVEGVPAVVDAARKHSIGTLLLRVDGPETGREVWAGHDPDQLAVRRTDAQALGEPRPESVRADDALLRAAAATGAAVLRVPGPAEGEEDLPVGGLGALLRWPEGGGRP